MALLLSAFSIFSLTEVNNNFFYDCTQDYLIWSSFMMVLFLCDFITTTIWRSAELLAGGGITFRKYFKGDHTMACIFCY